MPGKRNWTDLQTHPRVLISSCLLGENVRYNGKNKKNNWLKDQLGPWVQWHPLCPEVAMGLGVPREPIQLEEGNSPGSPKLLSVQTRKDLTSQAGECFLGLIRSIVLSPPPLCAMILKSESPSCALHSAAVFNLVSNTPLAMPSQTNQAGLFARTALQTFPEIPAQEESELETPEQREQFVTQLFTYNAFLLTQTLAEPLDKYHQKNRLLLMTFSPSAERKLWKLAFQKNQYKPYKLALCELLRQPLEVSKKANMMNHLLGELKDTIRSEQKKEVQSLIEDFQNSKLHYPIPLGLLRTLAERSGRQELVSQSVFEPFPPAIKFR